MPLVNLKPEQEIKTILLSYQHSKNFKEKLYNILKKVKSKQELDNEEEEESECQHYRADQLITALWKKYISPNWERILYSAEETEHAIEAILKKL